MDAEKALSTMGNPWTCRWTVACYIVISLMRNFICSWNFTGIVFLGAVPDHHCRLPPPEGVLTTDTTNDSEILNTPSGGVIAGQCHISFNASDSNKTVDHLYCPYGWEYEGDSFSMVNEWDLVCDRDYLADLSQVIFTVGTMVGSMFIGGLTDRFGRKKVLLFSTAAVGLLTLSCAWFSNFYILLATRFIAGVTVQGVTISSLVLLMELFPNDHRSTAGSILMSIFGLAMASLAGLAYFLRYWRHLLIAMAAPCLLVLPGIWLFQESIPWLMAHNKLDEARKVWKRVARWNCRNIDIFTIDSKNGLLPFEIVTEVKEGEEEKREKESAEKQQQTKKPLEPPQLTKLRNCPEKSSLPSPSLLRKTGSMFALNIKQAFSQSAQDLASIHLIKDSADGTSTSGSDVTSVASDVAADDDQPAIVYILKHPIIRRNTLILSFAFICISLSFFGLSLNTGNLSGDVYTNFAMSGLMEVPACLSVGFLSRCLGRKKVLSSSYVVGGLLLWLTVIIPASTDNEVVDVAVVSCAMLGKFCCAMGYCLLPIYCVELFPTTMRSFCLGMVYLVGRVGTALAPLSAYMTRHVWWFTGITFGSGIMAAGLLLLLLPETRGNSLPQSVADLEQMYGKKERVEKTLGI